MDSGNGNVNGNGNGNVNIYFTIYVGEEQLTKKISKNGSDIKINKLTDYIYYIFRDMGNDPELEHNHTNIFAVLSKPHSILGVATINEEGTEDSYKLVGFILAAPIDEYPDLFHIYYLYTTPQFRNIGIARELLDMVYKVAQANKYSRISLTFDTYNKKIAQFYMNNNFVFDPTIRSYKRHDMMVRFIDQPTPPTPSSWKII